MPSSSKLDLNVPDATVTVPAIVTCVPSESFFASSIEMTGRFPWPKVEWAITKTKIAMAKTVRAEPGRQKEKDRDLVIFVQELLI